VSDDRGGIERRDEFALADLDAAVGIVGATVGAAFGPLGSILGGARRPYAKFAVTRFMELRTSVATEVGLEDQELRRRIEESEPLAQMIAEVVRGTVESDLGAKRRLLARAAVHALKDDSAVNVEAVFVRTANALDTIDIHVLCCVAELQRSAPGKLVEPQQVIEMWPGTSAAIDAAFAALRAAGVVRGPGTQLGASGAEVTMTAHGTAFVDRLLTEGLEDELELDSNGHA